MYRKTAKSNNRVSFSTSLDKELLIKIKTLAGKKGVRINKLIEEALKHYYKL